MKAKPCWVPTAPEEPEPLLDAVDKKEVKVQQPSPAAENTRTFSRVLEENES